MREACRALAEAERSVEIARESGTLWPLPRSLRILALVRVELGEPGAEEALDEATDVAAQVGLAFEAGLIEEQRQAVRAG